MDKISIKPNLMQILEEITKNLGLTQFGVAQLEKPLSIEFYAQWLNESYHGDMNYLETHYPIKKEPQSYWKQAHSVLVFTAPYDPKTTSSNEFLKENFEKFPLSAARVSLYAQGNDYHKWFREKLNNICETLSTHFPHENFIPGTDSLPLLERDIAARSGIGWVGKNTCIISKKKGSLFFLGEIITSLSLDHKKIIHHDHCGTCTKCLDICPTQAFVKPRVLDARKCISYLTIESKKVPPIDLREKIGDWLFGCDLCQTVCPWNSKLLKHQLLYKKDIQTEEKKRSLLIEDLKLILNSSHKKLEKVFKNTPLARARGWGLKRNAMIVVANQRLIELKPSIQPYFEDPKLGELAKWTFSKLQASE